MSLNWFLLAPLLCHFVRGDFSSCKDTIDAPKMKKSYYGDSFLISGLTLQLMNRRKINKYLKTKLEKLQKIKHDHDLKTVALDTMAKGQQCAQVYKSCKQAAKKGTGVYLVASPQRDAKPFMAYCMRDVNGGDAWTVIQRRIDYYTYFQEGWARYEQGFGDVAHSFWMGLRRIHAFTYDVPHELLVQLENSLRERRFAQYAHFAVGGPDTNYTLTVLGKYDGNMGDSLRAHEGRNFATADRPNGGDAKCVSGGWWHTGLQPDCGQSHLNGNHSLNYWRNWENRLQRFEETKMAIREITRKVG